MTARKDSTSFATSRASWGGLAIAVNKRMTLLRVSSTPEAAARSPKISAIIGCV